MWGVGEKYGSGKREGSGKVEGERWLGDGAEGCRTNCIRRTSGRAEERAGGGAALIVSEADVEGGVPVVRVRAPRPLVVEGRNLPRTPA